MKQLKTCCFIGDCLSNHLFNFEEYNPYYIEFKEKLKESIINLIEDFSITQFVIGMDIGVEQYVAEIVLEFKKIYPNITLEGVIPFETQSESWSELQRDKYYSIMESCDKETLLQYHYSNDCMIKRDIYMVKKSKLIIIFCNNITSRISKLISYAKSIGRVIFIIDMVTLDIKPNIRIYK